MKPGQEACLRMAQYQYSCRNQDMMWRWLFTWAAWSDNPDSLRGQYFDGVVIDEVGDQNPRIWNEIIRPSLVDRGGFCVFIGTPKGNNHFYELAERAKTEEGWKYLEFKASQTGVVIDSELKAAYREMGEDRYNQEFECSFSSPLEGSYYGKIINDLERDGRISDFPTDGLCRSFVAWDLGMGDSTAIWIAQIAGKEVRLIDCVGQSDKTLVLLFATF